MEVRKRTTQKVDSRGRAVTKLTKTFAIFAVGAAILATGSAVAVKASVNFIQGFSVSDNGWNCSASAPATTMALTAEDRWNGQWQPASNDFTRFAWAGCSNGWAYGYVNGTRADGIDLSTLPVMR
jgi:hypothetical protein